MKIELNPDGIILCSLKLIHHAREVIVHNLVLDTGASETIIYRHAVKDLDIHLEDNDEFVFMRGIGGRETAFRKKVKSVEFGNFVAADFPIDFGDVSEEEQSDFSGLLGLDILSAGRFVIDLDDMELYQKGSVDDE